MGLFYAKDRCHYRRWINVLPSLLVPGSAHYLSGRKKAGIVWFCSFYFLTALVFLLEVHPRTPFAPGPDSPLGYLRDLFVLAAILDGLRKRLPLLGFGKGFILVILLCAVCVLPALTLRTFLIEAFKIPTDAMAPTLIGDLKNPNGTVVEGDRIGVNKAAYRFRNPQRGDLIVFKSGEIPGTGFTPSTLNLKRVVGLPGEKISLEPPFLVINGERVLVPDVFRKMSEQSGGFGGYVFVPGSHFLTRSSDSYHIKADEYFVLGDNSLKSVDSRQFGPVKKSSILGKAFYIYKPAERKGFVK